MKEFPTPNLPRDIGRLFRLGQLHLQSGDIPILGRAYKFAKRFHSSQKRSDGQPYVVHLLRVASYSLMESRTPSVELASIALLHDVLEDTVASSNDILRAFGPKVRDGVDQLTRQRPQNETPAERARGKRAKIEKLAKAPFEIRLVKCFDLMDNALSWKYIPAELPHYAKIPRWISEARELYVPFCRLVLPQAAELIEREMERLTSAGVAPGHLASY